MSGTVVHGVMVTFGRDAELRDSLRRIEVQSLSLTSLTIVDNNPIPCRIPGQLGVVPVHHLHSDENIGPAGGLAAGFEFAMTQLGAESDHWILGLDDDDPPSHDDVLAELIEVGQRVRRLDPRTAGVGLVGARFDRRRALLRRVPDVELDADAVPVDYIGGGHMPLYSVAAVQAVGVPRRDLFFGFEELEYGLRLGSEDWRLYAAGRLWHRERATHGRLGLGKRVKTASRPQAWRHYYGHRNLVTIAIEHCGRRVGYQVVARRLAKDALGCVARRGTDTRHLGAGLRASRDALRGRLGRIYPVG